MSRKWSYKYFSLKGYICKVTINLKHNVSKNPSLTIGLMYDNYKLFENMFSQKSSKCPIWGCYTVIYINKARIKKKYYII